jgi:hypothetical protein
MAIAECEGALGGLEQRLLHDANPPDVVILLGNVLSGKSCFEALYLREILDRAGVIAMLVEGHMEKQGHLKLVRTFLTGSEAQRRFSTYGPLKAFLVDEGQPMKSRQLDSAVLPFPFQPGVPSNLLAIAGQYPSTKSEDEVPLSELSKRVSARLLLERAHGLAPGLDREPKVPILRVGRGESHESLWTAEFPWPLPNGLLDIRMSELRLSPVSTKTRFNALCTLFEEQAPVLRYTPSALAALIASVALTLKVLWNRRRQPKNLARN